MLTVKSAMLIPSKVSSYSKCKVSIMLHRLRKLDTGLTPIL